MGIRINLKSFNDRDIKRFDKDAEKLSPFELGFFLEKTKDKGWKEGEEIVRKYIDLMGITLDENDTD